MAEFPPLRMLMRFTRRWPACCIAACLLAPSCVDDEPGALHRAPSRLEALPLATQRPRSQAAASGLDRVVNLGRFPPGMKLGPERAADGDELPGTSDAELDQQQCREKLLAEPAWDREVVAGCMTHAHNRARSQLSVSPPLPALSWSAHLADSARKWAAHLAQRCQGLEHQRRVPYGQNLAARSSVAEDRRFAPASVVDGWVAEAQCWRPGKIGVSDRCDAACVAKLNSSGCGHYTQVVWRATRSLGCGYASCRREGFLDEYWVCNYDPAGNVRGRQPY